MSELFKVRAVQTADVPFLYNSWLKSYRDSPSVTSIPNTLYYAGQHAVIEKLFETPDVETVIACNPEDEGQIYGYVVAAPGVLHWLYVKHTFRGHGVGKMLLAEMGLSKEFFYTHRVKNSDRLVGDRHAVFNPYLLCGV